MLHTLLARIPGLKSLAQPGRWIEDLFGARPAGAGYPVTPTTALECPPAYASIKVIAESVAQLPLILYERTADGGKRRATDHPLHGLLHDAANPWTSSYEFREGMQVAALTYDQGAIAFINRIGGRIEELVQIRSDRVRVETDPLTMEPLYKVSGRNGEQRTYTRSDIFHIPTMSGLSPVSAGREAISLALAMEAHAAKLFRKGGRPAGVLKVPRELSDDAHARLRNRWGHIYSGETDETPILEGDVSFDPVQFNSVDMQFLELRRYQALEVCRLFRVPPHLIQELERATFSNTEAMGQQFLSLTLLPWLKRWEGAISRSLLTPQERGRYFAEFLVDDLTRADLAARFEAYSKAVLNGLLSPNEVRAAENRPPYEGGDAFRLPLNTEDASRAGGGAREADDEA